MVRQAKGHSINGDSNLVHRILQCAGKPLTSTQIAAQLGQPVEAVKYVLHRHADERPRLCPLKSLVTKAELSALYLEQGLTAAQIGHRYHRNGSTILRLLHQWHIQKPAPLKPVISTAHASPHVPFKQEAQLARYLHRHYPELELRRRDTAALDGAVIDLYLPQLKLGIELSPVITHNATRNFLGGQAKSPMYHQVKALKAYRRGINLITCFKNEPDYDRLEDLIKTAKHANHRVFARKCQVKRLERGTARQFLNRYHDDGYRIATIHYGLYENGELLEVASFGKPVRYRDGEVELYRLATKRGMTVVGGFSKLLTAAARQHADWHVLLTYANLDVSNGAAYARYDPHPEVTVPAYEWRDVHNDQVVVRRGQSQKAKLARKYPQWAQLSETAIMTRLGYVKLYRCGNLKFRIALANLKR